MKVRAPGSWEEGYYGQEREGLPPGGDGRQRAQVPALTFLDGVHGRPAWRQGDGL